MGCVLCRPSLPVWDIKRIVPHPVQDELYRRMTSAQPGTHVFCGPQGSGKHHYMLATAHRLRREGAANVVWVQCDQYQWTHHTSKETALDWVSKVVLRRQCSSADDFVARLARRRSRPTALFFESFSKLADCPGSMELLQNLGRLINVVLAVSDSKTGRAISLYGNRLLCGGRWREEHVRDLVGSLSLDHRLWTPDAKERLVRLGILAGTPAFVLRMAMVGPFNLSLEAEDDARAVGAKWAELQEEEG